MRTKMTIAAALVAALAAPQAADAFCGFYVSGAGADLFANASQVVMMRSGTRTVLAKQNSYDGPAEDFAMVVPVPVVLQKDNVKTLPHDIFERVDKLAAPRLVEYWEQDPCRPQPKPESVTAMPMARTRSEAKGSGAGRLGVTVEAQFTVGEYQIVILSAKEATGLDTWLREEKYKIPDGAEPYLKPYVEGGSKFFVAKVDSTKVKFENGRAKLSPLRFHYESSEFSLPIRLGMMNSSGTQDLIVHILAPGQRYEVANYANVTIPTNLDVREEARARFGEFYAALFDRTLEKNKGAVVTEYSWDAGSCDPCPSPALSFGDLATLGADVVGGGGAGSSRGGRMMGAGFVLTRLHARYAKDGISEDLVFMAAPPIAGGREWRGPEGKLEEGNVASPINNFQGRYAIRHEWTGAISCASPVRGIWGGPPDGSQQVATGPLAATDLGFVKRGAIELAQVVRSDVPEIGLVAGAATAPPPAALDKPPVAEEKPVHSPKKEKKGCAAGGSGGGLLLAGLALLALAWRRRS